MIRATLTFLHWQLLLHADRIDPTTACPQLCTHTHTHAQPVGNLNMAALNTPKGSEKDADDAFQLYDLRVEVICPPGERIICGAKGGDYFTLQGEMLYLPPGQGISIYSLGEYCPARCE